MYNVCTCLYTVCTCIYNVCTWFNQLFRRNNLWPVVQGAAQKELLLHGAETRLPVHSKADWAWWEMKCGWEAVQTCLYCAWTCMYHVHTNILNYEHVCTYYIHLYIFMYMYIHVHTRLWFHEIFEQVHTYLCNIQTRMYHFAQSCPGGQDSSWIVS